VTRCRLDATGVAVTGAWAETDICGTVVSTVSATRTTSGPVVACMHHYECMHSAVQRHQSAERPILRQISRLMYPKIQRRQVIMNVLHPSCARLPRWSPPVLWRRFEDGLASICILIHSCKMPRESETTERNDG